MHTRDEYGYPMGKDARRSTSRDRVGGSGAALVSAFFLSVLLGFFSAGCGTDSTCDNCLQGCCREGMCLLPATQTDQFCGTGGNACQACTGGTTCDTQTGQCGGGSSSTPQCSPPCVSPYVCTRDTISGQDSCQPSNSVPITQKCGTGLCQDPGTGGCVAEGNPCSGLGQVCRNGVCQTGGDSQTGCDACMQPGMGQQCCNSQQNMCVVGNATQACGYGGLCDTCTGGQVCRGGACVAATSNCEQSCDGCCTPAGECKSLGEVGSGTVSDTMCGRGGSECLSCLPYSATCDKSSGECTQGQRQWSVCVRSAQIDISKECSQTVDLDRAYIKFSVGSKSPLTTDTYPPTRAGGDLLEVRPLNTCIHGVTQEELALWGAGVEVWDKDVIFDDLYGSCSRQISAYELGYGQQDLRLNDTQPVGAYETTQKVCTGCVQEVVLEFVPSA